MYAFCHLFYYNIFNSNYELLITFSNCYIYIYIYNDSFSRTLRPSRGCYLRLVFPFLSDRSLSTCLPRPLDALLVVGTGHHLRRRRLRYVK